MNRFARRLAVGFAVFLAIAEVARNWGDWGYWPFWVVDYLAVALLLFGARRVEHDGGRLLSGAWGFTCAMFYMSFFSHLAALDQPDRGPLDQRPLTLIIGILFALTIAGFAASLAGTRAARRVSGAAVE